MTPALRILEQITTDFTIFEKNQVLTESQLNSVTDYLNDQARLMRIHLLGVGVVAGLRVSISSNVITATKGVGITTDGDLLYYSNNLVFDRFLEYGKTYPKYAPFYVGVGPKETMIPVYELIAKNAQDPRSAIFPLSEFTIQTTKELKNMVAVLLMETYVKDPDLCTGTDCDNLGKDCINTPKLLLVEKSYINLLIPAIATPDKAFSTFNEIVADRPPISASITSNSQLTQIYQTVCTSIFNKLFAEIPNLYLKCSSFLADVFSSDPTNIWRTKLTTIHNNSLGSVGIQYYYDFLKDVVETYNQFWELLFGDMTWLCPDINWFPKHLLLGNLIVDSNLDENRTAFYPSPAVSQTSDHLKHAKFLARKLDTLIQTFQVPTALTDVPIRITPSLFEDQPLEERAIPYYYPVNTTNPIHKSWNYRLHQRRMDARNYSYNGRLQPKDGEYKAEGAAANPLTSQIGRFSFFRIEGHLEKNVVTVVAALENEIKSKNLPFTVCSILLGLDKTKVVKPPGIRYSDLHRFHYLLRQDTHHQLNEVERFSGKFKLQVDQNVAGESNAIALRRDAEQRNTVVTQNAKKVADKFKLHQNYAAYAADLSWKSELKNTVRAASEFKFNIGDVVKTEFTTPFDTLIGSTHFQWLDWMEQIIKKKDDSEDEKLLFVNFISQNPGMEHFAGVLRGGTFILVHDNNNTVVADFMLPYYLENKIEALPNEPPLTKPDIRPEEIIDRGIRVIPSVDKRLFDFRGVLEPEITQKFDLQQKYFDIYKGFVDSSTDIFTAVGNIQPQKFTDPILDVQIREVELEQEKIRLLRQREQKEQTVRAETELAQSLVAIFDYIAKAGISVTAGSDGPKAMEIVSDSVGSLNREKIALDTLSRGLEGVRRNNENNRELGAFIDRILSSIS